MKRIIIIILIATLISSVFIWFFYTFRHFNDDTLGGFPERNFPTSKKNVETAINNLYSFNPEFKVPDKWMYEDTSIKHSYFFLEGKTFYFKNKPEEIYYVTFIGDSAMLADPAKATISIRLVYNGGPKWFKYDELDTVNRKRIEERFDEEIISKLEDYTKTKSSKTEDDH
ncbi:MAG TPA: hypothetical protein VIM16_18650 [Mucilaginibacter sp.]|jgi:hypothetical protein